MTTGDYRIRPDSKSPPAGGHGEWRGVKLTVAVEPADVADASIFVLAPSCRFVAVSDIDDTVMHTGVANRFAMLWRLFVARAGSRVAFPGVAAFYCGLHDGAGGIEVIPAPYVSRALGTCA